jgi:hypothetical protein
MNTAQKTVAIGAASGVLSMAALVTLISIWLPAPAAIDALSERLAFALQLNVIAALPFFLMIVAVGNSRFLSDAIDPLAQRERVDQQVNGRVADNTLQQNFVFLVGTLALSATLSPDKLQVLIAATVVFVLARVVFWIGYRIHPLYRAPGMAATAYLNLGMLLTALVLAFF